MTRALETRVTKLELAAGAGKCKPPVMIVDFVGPDKGEGEMVGVTVHGMFIARPKSESEDNFIDRMIVEHRRPGPNGLGLIVERRWPDDPS